MQQLGKLTLANTVPLPQQGNDAPLPMMPATAMRVAVSAPVSAAGHTVHEVHAVMQMMEYFFCVTDVHWLLPFLLGTLQIYPRHRQVSSIFC